jgi:hypothetical protein
MIADNSIANVKPLLLGSMVCGIRCSCANIPIIFGVFMAPVTRFGAFSH